MAYFSDAVSNALNSFLAKTYEDTVMRKAPAFGLCAKDTEEYGKAVLVTVAAGYSAGEATTAEVATANQSSVNRLQFTVLPYKSYNVEKVDLSQAIYTQGGSDDEVVVDVLTDGMEKVLRAGGQSAENALFSSGYGDRATIKSSTNPTGNHYVLTLTIASDAWKFGYAQVLSSKATAAAGSLDAGTCKVEGTDPVAGTVSVLGDGSWTPSNTHVIGLNGVIAASTSPILWAGFPGWNPDVLNAPASNDSFYGVNRSVNRVALAGHAIDGRGLNVQQALNQLLVQMANTDGVDPDAVFMNNVTLGKFRDLIGNPATVEVQGRGIELGYEVIRYVGPTGPVNVIGSTYCDTSHIRVCDSSKFVVGSPGAFIQNTAKNNYIEDPSGDNAIIRMRASGFMYAKNPAGLGNALIA